MKKPLLWTAVAIVGLLSVMTSVAVRQTYARGNTRKDFVPPIVFQAAGPTIASIQSSVDGFRAALGAPNNANTPGPLGGGCCAESSGRARVDVFVLGRFEFERSCAFHARLDLHREVLGRLAGRITRRDGAPPWAARNWFSTAPKGGKSCGDGAKSPRASAAGGCEWPVSAVKLACT